MGDQNMEPSFNVDWSEESPLVERDPGASCDMEVGESTSRYDDLSFPAFTHKLHLQILPHHTEHCKGFDGPMFFRLGDPNVHFHAAAAQS